MSVRPDLHAHGTDCRAGLMWSERPITGTALPEGHLCLTFDDGPADPATLQIARYLADQQIPAVFFVIGEHAARHSGILPEVLRLGHAIGNHTWSHTRLTASTTSDRKAVDEVLAPLQTIIDVGGRNPVPFRAPYGAWNRHLAHVFNQNDKLRESHDGPIGWNIDGEDYRYWRESRAPEDCAASYLAAVEARPCRSGIVLFHDRTADGHGILNRTFEMIPLLVPQLRARGLRFTGLPT